MIGVDVEDNLILVSHFNRAVRHIRRDYAQLVVIGPQGGRKWVSAVGLDLNK